MRQYQSPKTVPHQGFVVAVASGKGADHESLYYEILGPSADGSDPDVERGWNSFRMASIPKQLAPAGMSLIGIEQDPAITGSIADVPIQVLSDQRYVYVFRQSSRATVFVNRFLMVHKASEEPDVSAAAELQPAWEVRFRRSENRDVPESETESQGYTNMNGDPFLEPTIELSFIENLTEGKFAVSLIPTHADGEFRWQFLSINGDFVDCYSIKRDPSGLFDLSDQTIDPVTSKIVPQKRFTLANEEGITLTPGGVACQLYMKQEVGGDGMMKRSGRLMVIIPVTTDVSKPIVMIDFGINTEGFPAVWTLPDQVVVKPMEASNQALLFDNADWAQLPNNQQSLTLGTTYTMEAWVRPDSESMDAGFVFGSIVPSTPGSMPPSLWIERKRRVGIGFGDGLVDIADVTGDVLVPGEWSHVAATFDGTTYYVYVNGVQVLASSKFTGKALVDGQVSALGKGVGYYEGALDEIRIWKIALSQAQIQARMYSELNESERLNPDLVGYWDLNDGTLDSSIYHNDMVLHGPSWMPSTAPIISTESGEMLVDNGLTVTIGLLTFVKTKCTPALFDSADGLLHLYFQGETDEFNVIQYDTLSARSTFVGSWIAGDTNAQTGDVYFSARTPGPTMNAATISIMENAGAPDLCDLQISNNWPVNPATENWKGVPTSVDELVEVLDGRATNEPGNLKLRLGTMTFFDYLGQYKMCRIGLSDAGDYGTLMLVTGRPLDAELQHVSITPSQSDPDVCETQITFRTTKGWNIVQTWQKVPREAAAFAATLDGTATAYAYSSVLSNAAVASLRAGGSSIYLIGNTASVIQISVKVAPATSLDPSKCRVVIEATTSKELTGSWDEVPRNQNAFISVLDGLDKDYDYTELASGDYKMLEVNLAFTWDRLTVSVTDQQALSSGTFVSSRVLLQAWNDRAKGNVGQCSSDAGILQSVTPPSADPTKGSALFAASSSPSPSNGRIASVQPGDCSLRVPGAFGGWNRAVPQYACAFSGTNAAVVDMNQPEAKELDIKESVSFEAWMSPAATGTPNTRVLTVTGQDSKYALGTTATSAIVFLAQASVTAGVSDKLCGPSNYTIELWINPNLETIEPNNNEIIFSKSAGASFERLTINKDGLLTARLSNGFTETTLTTKPIPDQQWSHVTVLHDIDQLLIYLNGQFNVSCPLTFSLPTPTNFVLGGNPAGSMFEMKQNQLRVWNRALPANEIAHLPYFAVRPDAVGLTLLWGLDAIENNKIVNLAMATGSSFNGTVTGNTLIDGSGVFCGAYAACQETAILSGGGVLAVNQWSHLACVYDSGYCLQFGPNDYANCGNDATLDLSKDLSIDAYVTLDPINSGVGQVILSKFGAAKGMQSYECGIDAQGFLYLKLMPDQGDVFITRSTAPVPLGVATHVAATFNATTVTSVDSEKSPPEVTVTCKWNIDLYINSASVHDSSPNPMFDRDVPISQSTTPVSLGRTNIAATGSVPPPKFTLFGKLADVRLWRRALTPDQVKSIYDNRGRVDDTRNLISYWRFDEQKGNIAFDSQGQNHARLSSHDMWALYPAIARMTLYLNGREMDDVRVVSPTTVGGYGITQGCIGEFRTTSTTFASGFVGQVDEVRIWKGVRTRSQILANMYRSLTGTEDHLSAYWTFDEGSGLKAADASGHGNTAVFNQSSGAPPSWLNSLAPVSNESPFVRNALSGGKTALVQSIHGTPAIIEYSSVEVDADLNTFSVMKRGYLYEDNGQIESSMGFECGELEQSYIGQVQTKPTVLGFIEGAPPLPSENMVPPGTARQDADEFALYDERSKVKLTEANDISRVFSSSRDEGFDMSVDIKGGLMFKAEISGGTPFFMMKTTDITTKVGLHSKIDFSLSTESESSVGTQMDTAISNEFAASGNWERPNSAGKVVNPEIGVRFVPDNTGYALVRSFTANLYAVRLKTTGALVSLVTVPNADIPEDINIIGFPIQPDYTKNGTLDGMIGFEPDPSFPEAVDGPTSYFKPIEAYSLKQKIDRENKSLEAYFAQFDAVNEGRQGDSSLSKVIEGDPSFDWAKRVSKKSLVNSYVWTAGGGFYAEQTDFSVTREESMGGAYEISHQYGIAVDAEGTFFGVGLFAELDFLFGQHIKVSKVKKSEEGASFGMEVEANPGRFMSRYDPETGAYSAEPCPGKVDDYRFMTFYLAPTAANGDFLFERVIDRNWLNNSSDPNAIALRQAQADLNGVWRVMHRVTFVSRIPPVFQPTPSQTAATLIKDPANLAMNWELTSFVKAALKGPLLTNPSSAQIGDAIAMVLNTTLLRALPWWKDFLIAAQKPGSQESIQLATIRRDMLDYMIQYYASGAAAPPLTKRWSRRHRQKMVGKTKVRQASA